MQHAYCAQHRRSPLCLARCVHVDVPRCTQFSHDAHLRCYAAEYGFALFLQIMGNISISLLVSNVLEIVAARTATSAQNKARAEGIKSLLTHYRLSPDLRARLRVWVVSAATCVLQAMVSHALPPPPSSLPLCCPVTCDVCAPAFVR
jgi:hypothetical protein